MARRIHQVGCSVDEYRDYFQGGCDFEFVKNGTKCVVGDILILQEMQEDTDRGTGKEKSFLVIEVHQTKSTLIECVDIMPCPHKGVRRA